MFCFRVNAIRMVKWYFYLFNGLHEYLSFNSKHWQVLPQLKKESIRYETILFILIHYVPVNNFSVNYVKIGQTGLNQYLTADKQAFKCPSTKSRERVGIKESKNHDSPYVVNLDVKHQA